MGHLIFALLHVIAILFGAVLLVITIPAHLIYGAIRANSSKKDAPSPSTHVRCPDCKEPVRKDAIKCRHCGIALVPTPATEGIDLKSALWTIVIVAAGLMVLSMMFGR